MNSNSIFYPIIIFRKIRMFSSYNGRVAIIKGKNNKINGFSMNSDKIQDHR